MAHFFEIEVNPALQRLSLKIWDGPKLIVDWFTTDNGGLMGGRVGMYSHSQVMMMKMLGMTMIIWVGIGHVLPSAGPQLLDKPENGEPSSSFLERGWSEKQFSITDTIQKIKEPRSSTICLYFSKTL